MARFRLDAKKIKAAAKAGNRAELWDTACEGLHVIVTRAGAATFAVRYRFEVRQRRLGLGRFGVVTPDEARKAAWRAVAAVASGEDPQGERQRACEGLSIDAVFERFIEEPGWAASLLEVASEQVALMARYKPVSDRQLQYWAYMALRGYRGSKWRAAGRAADTQRGTSPDHSAVGSS